MFEFCIRYRVFTPSGSEDYGVTTGVAPTMEDASLAVVKDVKWCAILAGFCQDGTTSCILHYEVKDAGGRVVLSGAFSSAGLPAEDLQ
jgi:hypothetical protein